MALTQEEQFDVKQCQFKIQITDWLNANAIASYSVANTIIEVLGRENVACKLFARNGIWRVT